MFRIGYQTKSHHFLTKLFLGIWIAGIPGNPYVPLGGGQGLAGTKTGGIADTPPHESGGDRRDPLPILKQVEVSIKALGGGAPVGLFIAAGVIHPCLTACV